MIDPSSATLPVSTPITGITDAGRAQFVTRTYQHLLGAILGFTAVEIVLFRTGIAYQIAYALMSVNWLLVIGGFMVAGWLFSGIAERSRSTPAQYGALAGYVVAEAIFFTPLLVLADMVAPGAIGSAALATMLGFSGLTAVAMYSGKDFTFMGSLLRWAGVGALVLIACGVLFGFTLGVFFSVAMVVLAGAAILYETSKILLHYPEDRYVAASLALFASVALMFWYVLSIFSRD
jgi:FtsH-binding integral membrane protein